MRFVDIIEFVIANVEPDLYYKVRCGHLGWDTRTRPNIRCLWHKEKTGSLKLSLNNGGARCHGCGKSIGNIVHFESQLNDVTEIEAAQVIYHEFIHQTIPNKRIERQVANLQFSSFFLSSLQNDLGFLPATIRSFQLGLDTERGRITIPIYNQFSRVTNIRYYQLPSMRNGKQMPKIFNEKGHGYLELFPWTHIPKYSPERPIFWQKAERDTILGIQDGLQCICTTGAGESASITEWIDLFKDFQIYILGDSDETGREQAAKKLKQLTDAGCSARILEIPGELDYSDYRLDAEGTVSELLDQLTKKKSAKPSEEKKIVKSEPILIASLQEVKSNLRFQNQKVKTKGIIIGILDRAYSIPVVFYVSAKNSPKRKFTIDISREMIWMIRADDEDIVDFVRKKFFPGQSCTLEPIEYVKATEVEICPIVDFAEQMDQHGGYTLFRGIFVGNHIDTNVAYELEIYPTTHIRTQEQVGIICTAKPLAASIDTRKFSPDEIDTLNEIRNTATDPDEYWDGVCNFANDISSNFTRIYNRLDWHLVALLTWLSPLYFEYANEGLQRGWLNSLVVGDTQTGKSQVVNSLQRLFNCGNVVNAENCTFVGLVGGTVKNAGGQFLLRWGRIPVNDRQLVAVEELSGLSTAEISRMSEVRSSGIARIDKAGITAETYARTRLLVLSNVRGVGKSLAGYPTGVRAILELVGQAEDVSRFDLLTTLTDEEVQSNTINQVGADFSEACPYNKEILQLLVRFIWCLRPNQIDFTEEAYLASLQTTKEMANIYHPSIPIFKAGSGRIKLARIATAIACSQFNWSRSLEKIVVKAIHIEAARRLLQMLYGKESFGYLRYSQKEFGRDRLKNPERVEKILDAIFRTPDAKRRLTHYIVESEGFTVNQFEIMGNLSAFDGRRLFGAMVDANILVKAGRDFWAATRAGRAWLDKTK